MIKMKQKVLNMKMHPWYKNINLFLIVFSFASLGFTAKADKFAKEFAVSLGMSNISYAETESKVENNENVPAQTGSVSVLSVDLNFKFLPGEVLDYYTRLSAPFLSASGDTYFSAHVGANYYFGSRGSRVELSDSGSTISFVPKFTYFAGLELGTAYLVFSNELVKRSDILFNLGLHAGAAYSINKKWGARAALHFARGTGANTGTTAIQFFAGAVYYFGAE